MSCAAAIAAVNVLRDDDLVGNAARLDPIMSAELAGLQERHPSVGAVRNIGLFGIFQLVRDRGTTMEPMAPFNCILAGDGRARRAARADGLYTMLHWNSFFTNPPLCITEEQLREGFAIIDRALEVTDAAAA